MKSFFIFVNFSVNYFINLADLPISYVAHRVFFSTIIEFNKLHGIVYRDDQEKARVKQ